MNNTCKILLIIESYPPILNSAGRLFSELAESLCQKGFEVVVLTEKPSRYLAESVSCLETTENGIDTKPTVIRLPAFPRLRSIRVLRYIEQIAKMVIYFCVGIFYGHHRDVIVYSPPLPLAVTGVLISKLHRTKSIVNVQDIYPETAIALGFMRNRVLIHMGHLLAKWVYTYADHITVHSEGNKEYISQNGANENKISVVYNWVDLDKYSLASMENGFREKNQLKGKFIVSYAGVIGLAQGFESLLSAARDHAKHDRIRFVLAGGGLGYDAVKTIAEEEGLTNILFLPHLEENDYVRLLKASNVCLVTLLKDLTTPAVPGKLQSIMAAGRPVICSVPSVSDAKGIVERARCGVWIDPSDGNALSREIGHMLSDDSLSEKGECGRRYAVDHFERQKCVEGYFRLLELNN